MHKSQTTGQISEMRESPVSVGSVWEACLGFGVWNWGFPAAPRAFALFFALLIGVPALRAAEPSVEPRILTTAAEIRALPANVASEKHRAVLRGVVTAAEPDWAGRFVMQDATEGIFVQNLGSRQPKVGDLVEVDGWTGPGWFAPVVQSNGWKKLGTAPLPPAKQVSIERLMTGVETSQRVEISGLVRSVTYVASQKTMLEISVGGYRVRVFPRLPPDVNPRSLVAAKVRVRGTVTSAFNYARRQLTAVNLMVPLADEFIVEEPEQHPPFTSPFLAIDDLAKFRTTANLGERLHVRGVLTFQRPGLDLFLQDETGGLRLESRSPVVLPVGRLVEAVGFLEIVDYQPVLRDAIYNEIDGPLPPVTPQPVPAAELRDGLHGGELIVLKGRLLDRSTRAVRREDAAFSGVRTICTIRHEELSFTAEYEGTQESAALDAIPVGSIVELTGIAALTTAEDGKLKSLTLMLPTPGSVRVLERPSPLTPERLLIGLAVLCVLLAAAAGWLLTVSRKNAMLKFLVEEREKAQQELQRAHDQLEVRVKERTEQLKTEMSARQAAEVEFRAVLTERTRLARELHDTLEQALTGISLQLDTALRLFARNPADAGPPLELARRFLGQSRLDLRRSIWDLRSRELEQFALTEALAIAGGQILTGSGISAEFTTSGTPRRLPEVVEENLLRIAQEALTNVLKHSGATAVSIQLSFGAEAVAMEIRDNGSGLIASRVAATDQPHYGLLGMKERAKRIGGRVDVSGPAGEGTTVRVSVSLIQPGASEVAPLREPVI
jgi:signal transduction histidine kinase